MLRNIAWPSPFKTYCGSFYGAQIWKCQTNYFSACCTSWNIAVRKIFRLPYTTHTRYLGPLLNQEHVSVQLIMRMLKLYYSMFNSRNIIIKSFISRVMRNSKTCIGYNIAYLRFKYNILVFKDTLHECQSKLSSGKIDTNDIITVSTRRAKLCQNKGGL